MSSITFIVLVGSRDTYRNCFLSSPLFQTASSASDCQIIEQSGYQSAGKAFNDGIERAKNDLIVCVHQDVILPIKWAEQFKAKCAQVESLGVPIGVVGCWGITADGERAGHAYHRDRQLFPCKPGDTGNSRAMSLPARVKTLDESLISFRKSSGLRFDPSLPSFFGYAVDLCLEAEARGLQNFAIDSPYVHQTVDQTRIRRELFESASFLIKKWRSALPIQTPSGPLVSKRALWGQKLKMLVQHWIGYSPSRIWWESLPQVNTRDVLLAEVPRKLTRP
jgi:hypothetical protein